MTRPTALGCTPAPLASGSSGPSRRFEAAKLWRQDAQVDLRRGLIEGPKPLIVAETAAAWAAGARAGTVRNRSGHEYKPSAIRSYEQALRDYILPAFGPRRLNELRRGEVQRLADELVERGLGAATVRNALLPLRAISRRALARSDISGQPDARARAARSARQARPRRESGGGN